MIKKVVSFSFFTPASLFLMAAAALPAQSLPPLRPSSAAPVADGNLGANEYSWYAPLKDMRLALSLSADSSVLYVGLEAPTSGWVAVGLGTLKMNGSFMVLGYDDSGKQAVSEQTGTLFGHRENKARKLSGSAVREQNKVTTLEFFLPAAEYVSLPSLKLIVAYGRPDNFTSKHVVNAAIEVPLEKKTK